MAACRPRYSGSPAKSTGPHRFTRNGQITAGNSGDRSRLPKVEARLDDTSPLVRAMAFWALSQLVGKDDFAARRQRAIEADPAVAEEWRRQ